MVGLNPDIAKIVVFKPLGSLAVSRDLGTGWNEEIGCWPLVDPDVPLRAQDAFQRE